MEYLFMQNSSKNVRTMNKWDNIMQNCSKNVRTMNKWDNFMQNI